MTRTLIGCPATEERQKLASILFATAQRQLERQRRNGIFHVCNGILTALTESLRNFRNGNGETATEWWKPGISESKTHSGTLRRHCHSVRTEGTSDVYKQNKRTISSTIGLLSNSSYTLVNIITVAYNNNNNNNRICIAQVCRMTSEPLVL